MAGHPEGGPGEGAAAGEHEGGAQAVLRHVLQEGGAQLRAGEQPQRVHSQSARAGRRLGAAAHRMVWPQASYKGFKTRGLWY